MNKKLILSLALTSFFFKTYAQQEEKLINEITIASKTKQKINKAGRNVILITEEDLKKYKGQNLNEVLSQVSGFQITGNYNNPQEPKTLRVRGGRDANVVILIDGAPLQDVTNATSNLADIRLFSLDNIESIEILNGASSVLYGSNAATSVINIKTKKYSNNKINATIGARIGSYQTYAQKLNVSGKSNAFSFHISGNNEKSGGLSSAEGDKSFDKDGFEKQNINIKLGVDLNKFNFNILGGWNHYLFDYDSGAFSDAPYNGNHQQIFFGTNINYLYKIGKVVFNTRYTDNKKEWNGFSTNIYKGITSSTEVYNELKLGETASIITGVQYEDHRMSLEDLKQTNLDIKDTKTSHFDAFANAHFNYSIFNIDAGVRMTKHSKFGEHWVYNVNPYFYQEFGKWFGKLGYTFGTAFITPTLYQTYGDGQWTSPNYDLKPETNQSQEINLSFGKQDRSLVINSSLFHRKEKNVLDYGNNSYINTDGNRTRGLEAGIDFKINSFIKIGGNFSFVEKKLETETTMLRQPKQRANSYIDIFPFKGNKISFTHNYIGKRFDVFYDANFNRNIIRLNDFNLFNIAANQEINQNLNIYFSLNNILNKTYVDVIGYTTRNRNFIFGVDYKF